MNIFHSSLMPPVASLPQISLLCPYSLEKISIDPNSATKEWTATKVGCFE